MLPDVPTYFRLHIAVSLSLRTSFSLQTTHSPDFTVLHYCAEVFRSSSFPSSAASPLSDLFVLARFGLT